MKCSAAIRIIKRSRLQVQCLNSVDAVSVGLICEGVRYGD